MKNIEFLLFCLFFSIQSYSQTIEYKSHYATISESTSSQLTNTETLNIETSLVFNYKDSLIILKTPNKKRVFWMLEYYEGVKEYIDATDNTDQYTFSFLYNKHGVIDVLILEDKKNKTIVTDFHIYETIKKD
ncbi:MAG: hypothetical protein II926_07375 [Bacteroidales bacterium]|nr:hypothetical protein [Bacteroidales bacterium]